MKAKMKAAVQGLKSETRRLNFDTEAKSKSVDEKQRGK